MIDKFGLWTYNDGWQVLLLVCVLFVASGILMGILWNTKGLADELSGRKRKEELEYLRQRFAEMNVRSLDEVKVADPLSHVGESAPAPLTPAGGVFTPQKVQQPLGSGEVLHVGGVAVSQQQVAAIKSELLGDDDEPVTGFFAGPQDGEVSEDTCKEEVNRKEAKSQPVNTHKEKAKSQPVDTRKEKAKSQPVETRKVSVETTQSKPITAEAPKPSSQQGINPVYGESAKVSQGASVSEKPADTANKAPSTKGIKVPDIAPVKPAILLVQAHAEQATGLLTPEEDDGSDSTPTGIFTPVEPTTEEPLIKVAKSVAQTAETALQTAEPAVQDSSEGITANLSPEVEDAAGVTTLFAPAGSRSAYRMEGAQFMGEIVSTGSYDPKTDTTKLEGSSGVDKATTGFLND